MRRDWNRRARENARHYVVTGQHQWTDEEFFQSGQITLEEEILNDLPNVCQGRDPKDMRVLEIGCGAGRVTRAFAGFFGEVYAVDISREMVRQAREAVRRISQRSCHSKQRQGSFGRRAELVGPFRNRPAAGVRFRVLRDRVPTHSEPRNHRELRARSSPLAAPRRAIQISGAGRAGGGRERTIAGSANRSPNSRPAKWRNAVDLNCAINTAPATSITGFGTLSGEVPDILS